MGEDIGIAVIKSDHRDLFGDAAARELCGEPAQRDDTAQLHQRLDLLGKPLGPNGKLPWIVRYARDSMKHQNDRPFSLDEMPSDAPEVVQYWSDHACHDLTARAVAIIGYWGS